MEDELQRNRPDAVNVYISGTRQVLNRTAQFSTYHGYETDKIPSTGPTRYPAPYAVIPLVMRDPQWDAYTRRVVY